MDFYKKWLNIAIVFILSFSLFSPAALAETQLSENSELETSSIINNQSNDEEADISQLTENELSSNTTNDSATIHSSEPKGYVTVSVEKFTLGQGYINEPVRVPFYEGDNVAQVLVNLLGDGNYENMGSVDSSFYLAAIYDPSPREVKVPQYILDKSGPINERTESNWLGQFDYTDMSGWMVAVKNDFISRGASDWFPEDGDVIRWQFTVWGYGADLGGGFGGNNYINPANKDVLTAKIAEINSAPNKNEILANTNVKSAYDAAYLQLTNMESSQSDVDTALTQLYTALNGDDEEVVKAEKTVLQADIQQAESTKASVKVSVDGKDIAPTDYWVTQAEQDAYTNVIISAQQLIADENAIQEDIDAKVLALNQATALFNQAKNVGLQAVVTNEVKFTVAPKTVKLNLYDANEQEINIGAGAEGTYNVYTATIPIGNYRYEGFDSNNKSVGGGKLTVTTEPNQEFKFRQLNFKASNTGWVVDNDYTVKVGQDISSDTSLKLGDVTAQGQIPVLALTGKTFFYQFEPDAKHTQYVALSNSITITIAASAQAVSTAIPFSGNMTFTVPQDAELFIGKKIKHFITFEEILPEGEATINPNGTKTYPFKLVNNGEYNYRVSQAGKLTNTGTFKANAQNASLEITKEQLDIQSPKAILNKDTYLEGNIYLNINEQNHLKLNEGASFKLLPLRSWQALIEGINNYFFEPDFHYEIITGNDVIAIEPGKPGSYSTVKALKNGTAIVKVTYDALKVNGSSYITNPNDAFSAIWAENVGLFVVTVGQGETGISTGIESNKERNQKANEGKKGSTLMNLQNGVFDADIDSVYYVQDQPGAYYTFTPTAGSSVSLLRPEINHGQGTASYGNGTFSTVGVQPSENDSFTVLLTEGRNIVKIEKEGKVEYHVLTARPLDITIENLTKPKEKITPGDKVKVTFKGLSFPANKLAGIYNFNAQLNFIGGPEQQLIAGLKRQYNITTQANDVTFTIPENHKGEYILEEGYIKLGFFGSPMGDHRNIDPQIGANPNFNASEREGYYSIFPKITIIAESNVGIDNSLLQTAIDMANQNKTTVKVSADGKNIDPTDYWVTQAEQDAYTNVIVSAQQLISEENAIQENIDAKVLALNQATTAFNQAKKAGTKSNADTTTSMAYNTVGQYMVDKLPNPKFGNEWWIIALARGGYEVPTGYYDTYYKNVVDYVISKDGVLDQRKYTEYSRLIIALTAIKKDPTNVGGYNLVEKLSDFDKVIWQGVNGAYFGLIALNTWDFELSKTATTTREKLIDYILNKQLADDGWALSGTKADPDMTAMAIQSLAPYYNNNAKVKTAIDSALATLAAMQLENGGFKSWGTENSESAAQVVTALSSLGIDANKDPRFNKVVANLMTYYSPEDGGFKHILSEKKANGMATEQVGYTLAAYYRLLNGQTALYDMSDTKSNDPSNPGDGGNPSNPGDGGNNNNPGNGGDNNNPGGSLPNGHSTLLIRISSSEVPLRETSVELYPGETVFDVLKRATTKNGIALSYRETQYGTYIDGIAGLYEFDRGPLSGWMYRVNGHFPSYSAALYTLSPGDSVEWLYTLDLGKDIGGYVDGIENGGAPTGGSKEEDKKKCTDKDEQCTEETNKDSSVAEITIQDGSNKVNITSENIQKYIEKNIQKLVILSKDNFKLEVPTSIFTGIKLAKNEQIRASVTKNAENKQFTVTFGIESTNGKTKSITIDKEYLKVTLLANKLKPNSVVLQLVGGEYKPVPHRIVNGEIVLFTKTSGTFVVTESTVTFNDIAHLANKEEIEFLASRLIIQGTTPETFEPNKQITRAQFAALISRALGLQATGENPFNDTEGKWYATDIQALFEAGITKGSTASTFNPEAPITRQQGAAFMARILEYLNTDVKPKGEINFNDANHISAEYLPYIKLLNSLEIMTGKQDGSFDPGAPLTRGQTAKILKRTLNIPGIM
ncbi:S-layer homology domain-containing protein [Psychrobacillus sp. INOP01]|uniref:S-layer homology domain-containing protein n=1 Tax=Psychrobacillus sp. INOP01 TaxID=2829187 RepID=UPI001BA8D692|nr:S-layer homology domain-containing protein [Psychrobacillus sp. INOP01]QUG42376.1 S-layer homology domain-containing protein [Psychrobacillus sp. INOP01]